MPQLKNFKVCNSVVFSVVTESCNHHSSFTTSIDGHLSYLHVLAIISNSALNILAQVFVWT